MRFAFLLAAFVCTVSAAQAANTEGSIIGHWYEDMLQNGVRTIALFHSNKDGTFAVEFRKCFKGGSEDSSESGHWSYAGSRLILTIEVSDGIPTHYEEVYETVSNNGRIWDYRFVSGVRQIDFHDVRVTATSKMPGCDLSS